MSKYYVVTLDDTTFYMGDDYKKALLIHGTVTAVLFEKKISGVVNIVKGDGNESALVTILSETWIDGVKQES